MALPRVTGWAHLGAAPEIFRDDRGGHLRVTFSAAFNKKWQEGATEKKQTTWLRCVAWGAVAAAIEAAQMATGQYLWLGGELKHERTTDDNGNPRDRYELVCWEVHLPLPRAGGQGGRSGPEAAAEPG